MPKALFFDLDGTLTDTHALHIATWMEVLRSHGVEVDMDLYRNELLGKPNEEAVRDLLPDLSDEEVRGLLEAEARSYRGAPARSGQYWASAICWKKGAGAAWRSSSSPTPRSATPRSRWRPWASTTPSTRWSLPRRWGREARPRPLPGRAGEARVSAEETLAFEDSPKGVASAVEAGIPVVGLVSTHAPGELRGAGAEFVVGNFSDPGVYDRLGR